MIKSINDSYIYQQVSSKKGKLEQALSAWSLLHNESEDTFILNDCKTKKVEYGDVSFELLFNKMPGSILESLPIPDHQLYDYEQGVIVFYEKCLDAAKIINEHLDDSLRDLPSFVNVFTPVKLASGSKEKMITSLTIPDLPFTSFISENSFFHLAPDVVNKGYGSFYLSENIVHEMVHNLVNLILLEHDLLIDDYSSLSSPKVKIPWRKGAELRNQYWEIDRMLHAFCVYSNLSLYRSSLAKVSNSGVTQEMVEAAVNNSAFLRTKILENKNHLTNEGIEFILSINSHLNNRSM